MNQFPRSKACRFACGSQSVAAKPDRPVWGISIVFIPFIIKSDPSLLNRFDIEINKTGSRISFCILKIILKSGRRSESIQ